MLNFPKNRTLIMGILNVTPDSFSDGGAWLRPEEALFHAKEMLFQGADIIDIGGQSTRPGYKRISQEEELERVLQIFKKLKDVPFSVDTFYPAVARAGIENGALIINDISAFEDREMIKTISGTGVGYVLMNPGSRNSKAFFSEKIDVLLEYGIKKENICLDPGIGFGKSHEQNLQIIQDFSELKEFGCDLMAAASRKRVVAIPNGNPPPNTLDAATIAVHTLAMAGGANILRVHNVPLAVQAARAADAVLRSKDG